MDIGSAILIIGFAALAAAFVLLVIGLVYAELINSEIPRGVANSGKLHMVHGLFVGIAVVVSIYRVVSLHYVMFPTTKKHVPASAEIINFFIIKLTNSLVYRKCFCLNWIKKIHLTLLGLCQRWMPFLCPQGTDKALRHFR